MKKAVPCYLCTNYEKLQKWPFVQQTYSSQISGLLVSFTKNCETVGHLNFFSSLKSRNGNCTLYSIQTDLKNVVELDLFRTTLRVNK